MKLLAKTSWYYLLFSIPVLMGAGFICYYLITSEVRNSNNELLLKRKSEIEKLLLRNDSVSLQMIVQSNEAIIYPVKATVTADVFTDTLIFDVQENEMAPHRMLSTYIKTGNTTWLVHVWRSTLEFEELFEGIITALLIILVFLFIIFFTINWWISHTLWKPFYKTLEAIQNFNPGNDTLPSLQKASVKEFIDLNNAASSMMEKMSSDFKNQKQFTENAAHEMQTPLAVIKAKIDLLIQSEKLGISETDLIADIDNATSRLSRLNKALLLLSKIENRQFIEKEKIMISKMIDDSLIFFSDHISAKQINITKSYFSKGTIEMNADLCAILINNLLQNAIRHNVEKGSINITLNDNELVIANTGNLSAHADEFIFRRFQKNSTSNDSIGLGLAIAKEIANSASLKLNYRYSNNLHCFSLKF